VLTLTSQGSYASNRVRGFLTKEAEVSIHVFSSTRSTTVPEQTICFPSAASIIESRITSRNVFHTNIQRLCCQYAFHIHPTYHIKLLIKKNTGRLSLVSFQPPLCPLTTAPHGAVSLSKLILKLWSPTWFLYLCKCICFLWLRATACTVLYY